MPNLKNLNRRNKDIQSSKISSILEANVNHNKIESGKTIYIVVSDVNLTNSQYSDKYEILSHKLNNLGLTVYNPTKSHVTLNIDDICSRLQDISHCDIVLFADNYQESNICVYIKNICDMLNIQTLDEKML